MHQTQPRRSPKKQARAVSLPISSSINLRPLAWIRWFGLAAAAIFILTVAEGYLYGIDALLMLEPDKATSISTVFCATLALWATLIASPLYRPSNAELTLWSVIILSVMATLAAQSYGFALGAGSMGTNTAVTFCLMALGQILSRRLSVAALGLTILAAFAPFLSMFGYLHGNLDFAGAMSPYTAVIQLSLVAASIIRFARNPVVRPIVRGSPLGIAMRRVIMIWLAWILAQAAVVKLVPMSHLYLAEVLLTLASGVGTLMIIAYLGMFVDLATRDLNSAEREMYRALQRDAVTGASSSSAAEMYFRTCSAYEPMGLVLFTIDRIDFIRESRGSIEVDRLLGELGTRVKAMLRPTELFVRWDANTFVLVERDQTIDNMEMRAITLCNLAREIDPGTSGDKALSILAVAAQARRDDREIRPTIERANSALKQSKGQQKSQMGKLRVVSGYAA